MKGEISMKMQVYPQESVKVISINEAIEFYLAKFPNTSLEEIELEFDGARYKYECYGVDDSQKYYFDFNAVTKTPLKENTKPLKEKEANGVRRERKAINTENLISLEEATNIAKEHAKGFRPFEWSLERSGDLTVYEIEWVDASGDKEMEVKLNAQTGDLIEIEFAH